MSFSAVHVRGLRRSIAGVTLFRLIPPDGFRAVVPIPAAFAFTGLVDWVLAVILGAGVMVATL